MSETSAKETSRSPKVRVRWVTFYRDTKTPKNIEEKFNDVLGRGKLINCNFIENPATARLYCGLVIDESGESDTAAKVFREAAMEDLTDKTNRYLDGNAYKSMFTAPSSKSNFLTTVVFVKRKK